MVEQRRGEADFVKVLDFGIAKIVDGTNDDGPALTRAGFVCGTPEYMSPEQARGAQLDHRSDLYAVGVILYQLTSGLLPFDSDSAVGFATKHLTEVPPPPSKRRPDAKISPGMERLIMRALAKSPDDRPQTAEQFRAELLAIEKERRVAATGVRRPGTSAPGLNQVHPRKVTPIDQQETRVNPPSNSPWASHEATVKSASALGPVPDPMTTAPTAAVVTESHDTGASGVIFKVATAVLVVLALGLGGVFAWTKYLRPPAPERHVIPVNAPVPGVANHLHDPPAAQRQPAEAIRVALEGDEACLKGAYDYALSRYLDAWSKDPQPELALKIGELYFHKDEKKEARAYWERYRRDAPSSKAVPYVEQMMKD
jgi:serine/threonine-protein kinase